MTVGTKCLVKANLGLCYFTFCSISISTTPSNEQHLGTVFGIQYETRGEIAFVSTSGGIQMARVAALIELVYFNGGIYIALDTAEIESRARLER
jgi:hypothetical protein